MDNDSVILAVASPPGRSWRGIIRLSGWGTSELLSQQLKGGDERAFSWERGVQFTLMPLPTGDLPVCVLSMPGPRSYTGEDCAELQFPGNPALLDRAVAQLLDAAASQSIKARMAEPGEFTARAFFNGRLTLTQAEGVAATIAARSDAELRAAKFLESGSLGLFASAASERLAGVLALVEAGIDFTDQDDVVAIAPDRLREELLALQAEVRGQLERSVGMEQIRAIPWVVLTGPPNAGKSTLFNALLGHPRAVVSSTPGTTRDILAEPLHITTDHGDAEVLLVDIAGRDDEDGEINRHMQRVGDEALRRAELTIRCIPPGGTLLPASHDSINVLTKSDLRGSDPSGAISVCAHTFEGVEDLRHAIAQALSRSAISLAADAIVLGARHDAALHEASEAIQQALEHLESDLPTRHLPEPELIAHTLRTALDAMTRLSGAITPDDVLGLIFSKFCIGK